MYNNFLCRQKPIALFTVLCEKYQPTLERDPSYKTVRKI